MQAALNAEPNISLLQVKVEDIITEGCSGSVPAVTGVLLDDGTSLHAAAVVITTGTFLNGLMHCGTKQTVGGRHGEGVAQGLSASLRRLGIRMGRFKTGTTPRIDKKSLDFSILQIQPSEDCPPFSFINRTLTPLRELLPCWQTNTTTETHRIIQENLHLSAMYSGRIEGVGPRYCPSIEDKVVRFADKDSHPVFLEQEEWDSDWIYVQGMSTSLPAEVQELFLKTLPGLENVRMFRPGYAVEYDMAYPISWSARFRAN